MTHRANAIMKRAFMSFFLGLLVCLAYWFTGFIPREVWFDAQRTDVFITSKYWFWPGAILDVVFRELQPVFAAIALYAINGITYLVISLALFVFRSRPGIYLLITLSVGAALTWFNASVMQTFSWLWLAVLIVLLGFVSYFDLRPSRAIGNASGRGSSDG